MERTLVWGHRGASGYAPENTMAAFEKAVELGADGIELDVQLTKDGELVIIHDETIDRVSDGSGWVKDFTYAKLIKHNFNRTHPEYEHAQIPTLEEVYALIKPTDLTINVEIKTGVVFYPEIEARVLDLTERMGLMERVIFSSFNHYTIQKIKEINPEAETGMLYSDGIINPVSYASYVVGAKAKIIVINNLSSDNIKKSVDNFSKELKTSQIIFIPGGFSGGDEPDGSGKFITAFFRNYIIKEETTKLLDKRGGLILGICNGFQALIKLGLVPFGKIIETDENCPTLTFNEISRHQSKIVRTRIASNKSPWLSYMNVGDIVSVPISHGEGRFIASEELIKKLSENGQIATQYVDFEGDASNDIRFNPNGSIYAIEGITSPDGRVFGKMGHSERIGKGLYKNVLGNYDIKMFKSAVEYFK